MNILVLGAGYVGLSTAAVFAKKYKTKIFEIDEKRKISILNKISPFEDKNLNELLKVVNLSVSDNFKDDLSNSDLIVLALPTNYDPLISSFDTSALDSAINTIASSKTYKGVVVIKSTVPVGYAQRIKEKYPSVEVISCPEFLREGRACQDAESPSRVILGGRKDICVRYSEALLQVVINKPNILYMSNSEAETAKLFANTYLASRVAFFNELDTFCRTNELNSKNIIQGICTDGRIGMHYNNPSFGYGGYCLPKDTLQSIQITDSKYSKLIHSIHVSNESRKNYFVEKINGLNEKRIGFYRLVMKSGSDNFRESASVDIVQNINKNKDNVFIYEPALEEEKIFGIQVIQDLELFLSSVDCIVANRLDRHLQNFTGEIISADLFFNN